MTEFFKKAASVFAGPPMRPSSKNEEIRMHRDSLKRLLTIVLGTVGINFLGISGIANAQVWPERIKKTDMWKVLEQITNLGNELDLAVTNFDKKLKRIDKNQLSDARYDIFVKLPDFCRALYRQVALVQEQILEAANIVNSGNFSDESISRAKSILYKIKRDVNSLVEDFEAVSVVESAATMRSSRDGDVLPNLHKKIIEINNIVKNTTFEF